MTPEELAQLVYDVDVLTEPEPIDSPDQLDVKRYGVIVQCGDRRGLLLPDLAGVDTVEQQIDIARRKGEELSAATEEEKKICERVTGIAYDQLWNTDNMKFSKKAKG